MPIWSKYRSWSFRLLYGDIEPTIDEIAGGSFILGSHFGCFQVEGAVDRDNFCAMGDALLEHGAGPVFCSANWGSGQGKAVGTFAPLAARYGLENVPTPIEIIAELLACHAGARGFEPRRSRHDFDYLGRYGTVFVTIRGVIVTIESQCSDASCRSSGWKSRRPPPRHKNPEQLIDRAKARAQRPAASEHGQLMPQCNAFQNQCRRA